MTVSGIPGAEAHTAKISEYLFTRLHQLGVRSIFGVPGDYNLRLLDFVEPAGLHWVGNCNELNAAYAADGYARVNGFSALITTFGVGELSAINGIAGAFAEKAPVIHIVGTPARSAQYSRSLLHHTLADGDYRHFASIASHVTRAQANLLDPRTIPEQIDAALRQAIVHSQPVYIEVPEDVVDVHVVSSGLNAPLIVPESPHSWNEPTLSVLNRMYSTKRPLILVDGECRALSITREVNELVVKTGWPTWSTVFGKSIIDETLPNYYGNYIGSLGSEVYKTYFETADLIISLGPHHTDTNTGSFSMIPANPVSVSLSRNVVRVGNEIHRDVSSSFLSMLLQNLDTKRVPKVEGPPRSIAASDQIEHDPKGPLVQKSFWRFVNRLFRPGDLILTETGTSSHGGRHFELPTGARLFGAVTWLSIGYMLPATLGAALAKSEVDKDNRAILFIGDGSIQMSVQEISTMIKENLDIIIFIINNGGYTIERAIHGRNQGYNDVAPWRHSLVLQFFGANEKLATENNFTARNYNELDTILSDDRIQKRKGLRVIEIFMGREDVQGALVDLLNTQIAKEK
ncbi:pyruvate decarboxylase [Penicillium pulvis]|uniref:pyruvate decarboxylase n=1 Tax=Penicillium pulvis TaxID=1562058 RepID=UPI002548E2E8|nr:pyruvate decarboxylase [Penicillium pulvis]KAJ5798630.1 pyruvate decarboxylase [Penicillium pulvis]